jgi:hypothetical protein
MNDVLQIVKKPSLIQFGITERCNLRCVHCDIWKKKKKKELGSEQWLSIVLRLRNWLGPFRLDISGGEPFIRNDLFEILEFCHKNQISPVVTTNATLLDKEMIDRLSEIDSLTLNISLDGIYQQTHDYLRGVPGVQEKVIDVLNNFNTNQRKCRIVLATILMGYNISEILNLIKVVIVDGLADGINFQALDYNFGAIYDKDWYRKSPLWPTESKKEYFVSVIEEIISLKKNGIAIFNSIEQLEQFKIYFCQREKILAMDCNTVDKNFIVNPSGEVLLCWNMEPIGDVTEDKPDEIWNSPLAVQRRREIKRCCRTCRILNCNFNE